MADKNALMQKTAVPSRASNIYLEKLGKFRDPAAKNFFESFKIL